MRINLFKTIWYNFKFFPLNLAVKFPLLLYGRVCLKNVEVKIETPLGGVHCGMLRVGDNINTARGCNTRIIGPGTLVVEGESQIKGGTIIRMECGVIRLGEGSLIGKDVYIHIGRGKLVLEELSHIGMGTLILGTDSHYVLDTECMIIRNNQGDIILGKGCWVCSYCSVMKGACLPSYGILLSRSLLNKDFGSLKEGSFFGGIPAKYLGYGKKRIYNCAVNKSVQKYFDDHPDEEVLDLTQFVVGNFSDEEKKSFCEKILQSGE